MKRLEIFRLSHQSLHGVTINGDIIPNIIDEIPILSIAASFAKWRNVNY
jgi:5-enolpyruvylshikimate-3-phosphate synthase